MRPKPVILVEGPDDYNFVGQLLRLFNVADDAYSLKTCEGYGRLRRVLHVLLKSSEPGADGCVAAIVDADSDPSSRWQSLVGVLAEHGYEPVPAVPDPIGTVLCGRPDTKPVVALWMWPDNVHPGTLEDFVSMMIRETDSTWRYAQDCVNGIDVETAGPEERLFKELHRRKAQVHTWLAWREQPGRPMGHAVKLNFLNQDAKCAQVFRAWLMRTVNTR